MVVKAESRYFQQKSQTDDFSLPDDFLIQEPQQEVYSEPSAENDSGLSTPIDTPLIAHSLTPSRLSRSVSMNSNLSSASNCTVRSTDSRHSLTPSRKSTRAVQRKIAESRI